MRLFASVSPVLAMAWLAGGLHWGVPLPFPPLLVVILMEQERRNTNSKGSDTIKPTILIFNLSKSAIQ